MSTNARGTSIQMVHGGQTVIASARIHADAVTPKVTALGDGPRAVARNRTGDHVGNHNDPYQTHRGETGLFGGGRKLWKSP